MNNDLGSNEEPTQLRARGTFGVPVMQFFNPNSSQKQPLNR